LCFGFRGFIKMDKETTKTKAQTMLGRSALMRLVMFLRRHIYCRFDTHANMQYDSGMANDIGRAGICLDCGYRAKGIKWARMPNVKPPKVNLPLPPKPPPCREMKETLFFGLIETEESKQKTRDWDNYIRGYGEGLGARSDRET